LAFSDQFLRRTLQRKRKLGSATLTVAVLVFVFLILTLAALLGLVLGGLVIGLALSRLAGLLNLLSGLATLLALPRLALLTLFLHIVSHIKFLLRKRGSPHAFEIYRDLQH
jgi:hypothetical protein